MITNNYIKKTKMINSIHLALYSFKNRQFNKNFRNKMHKKFKKIKCLNKLQLGLIKLHKSARKNFWLKFSDTKELIQLFGNKYNFIKANIKKRNQKIKN